MAGEPTIDAKARLSLILHRLEREATMVAAARTLADGDGYCDFFVENNDGGPFHEKCGVDPFLGLAASREKFSERRMQQLSRVRRSAADDYPDFFVEGSGPPWHERIDDFGIKERLTDPAQRAFTLRRSNVIQTFTRIAEAATRESIQGHQR